MYLADDDRSDGADSSGDCGPAGLDAVSKVWCAAGRANWGSKWRARMREPEPRTAHPTAEKPAARLQGLALSFVTVAGQTYRHITPLSEVQHRFSGGTIVPSRPRELAVDSPVNPP